MSNNIFVTIATFVFLISSATWIYDCGEEKGLCIQACRPGKLMTKINVSDNNVECICSESRITIKKI